MKRQRLTTGGGETIVVVFDKGDDPVELLTQLARDDNLGAARFTGIGAFESVVLGYFDREAKDYERIEIAEQVELVSLLGDIALDAEGNPAVHAHVVVAKSDGSAHGGHLLEASVWPTLELVLTDTPDELRKRIDPETGLALISP